MQADWAPVDEQATRFVDHVCGHTDRAALRLAGLTSGNYWLTTQKGFTCLDSTASM